MARVCVVRQFYVPDDPRVSREVGALLQAGHEVDVLCLRKKGQPLRERRDGLVVRRVPIEHRRGGPLGYVVYYGAFLLIATVLVGLLHLRRRYDVVQVNTVPDTLVFAALVPRLLGARVLLDLHESMPEFYMTKFGVGPRHPVVRLVARLEQASIRFATEAITCTEQQRETFIARGATRTPITVVLNSADEELFDPSRYPRPAGDAGRFTVVCHGTIEQHYGLDTLVRATALLKDRLPGLQAEIYGDGGYRDEVRELIAALGVEDRVRLSDGRVPYEELLPALARADAGVVAMKRDAFRDLTHCNKMYDFIAMRRPAIVSRTRSVEAYFDQDSFGWFAADDAEDLARAIQELHADRERGERMAQHAAKVAEPYRWPRQREVYLGVVERLLRAAGR